MEAYSGSGGASGNVGEGYVLLAAGGAWKQDSAGGSLVRPNPMIMYVF
jgi:hypothetical protein